MVARGVALPATLAIVTPYEAASLWAQWVGSISAALAVFVAALFGSLTYANNRRSRDNQERATLVAAMDGDAGEPRSGILPLERVGDGAEFVVRSDGAQRWLLVNSGSRTARDVQVSGLTALDRERLSGTSDPGDLAPGQSRGFGLVSRFASSGPANIVVRYRLEAGGPELRRVLQVPAP